MKVETNGNGLWESGSTNRTVALLAGGALLMVVAYIGAEAQDRFASQIVWLNLAVVGSLIAASGQAVWLLEGRRALGLERRRLFAGAGLVPPVASGPLGQGPRTIDDQSWVVVPGGQRLHRPTCLLATGKLQSPAEYGPTSRKCEVCGSE